MYIIHQLPFERKQRKVFQHEDHAVRGGEMRSVAAGIATLGVDPEEIQFGWDNEFRRTEVEVDGFDVATYPVTNGDWLRFVADGGAVPLFWKNRDGSWLLRLQFEEIPLPQSWPVYVTHQQAEAYARWSGMRLPTEAEYHRAAFGTAAGEERAFPWGDATPAAAHGNFGFSGSTPSRSTRIRPARAHGA